MLDRCFAFLSFGSVITLFGRNLICREISATASACSSAACSSAQNACAAEVRRSEGIWRHTRAGRTSSDVVIGSQVYLRDQGIRDPIQCPDERNGELLRSSNS